MTPKKKSKKPWYDKDPAPRRVGTFLGAPVDSYGFSPRMQLQNLLWPYGSEVTKKLDFSHARLAAAAILDVIGEEAWFSGEAATRKCNGVYVDGALVHLEREKCPTHMERG